MCVCAKRENVIIAADVKRAQIKANNQQNCMWKKVCACARVRISLKFLRKKFVRFFWGQMDDR